MILSSVSLKSGTVDIVTIWMRKKSARGVLASLRGSPYGIEYYEFASLRAAALLDSLLCILHSCSESSPISISAAATEVKASFFAAC
jgi:hypothetical protein